MIILTLTSTEKSFHQLFEGTTWNFRGEHGICDYGKTRGADNYCTCTAAYSKCFSHALLYTIEFAGEHRLRDPTCTERACSWNNSSK